MEIGTTALRYDISVARRSIIPISDNALNLGSNSLRFATAFVSSLENSGAIKVKPSNSESLQFESNGIRTNLTNFRVYTNTSDSADNSELSLTAGGAYLDATRGAWIRISGNEHANTGSIAMRSGDNANSAITLDAYGSSSFISLKNQNTHIVQITALGMRSHLAAGLIYTSTNDTSDNAEFNVCGGGGSSISRGARSSVFGNEHSTNPGQAGFTGGGISGGHVYLTTSNSGSYIQLSLNGTKEWELRTGAIMLYTAAATIASLTIDGSDNLAAYFCGGGSGSASRGSYLAVFGNEHGNTGTIQLWGGAVSAGHIALVIGHSSAEIRFYNASTAVMWSVNNSGQLTQDSTNGGDIILGKTGASIRYPQSLTITAAGSNQAGATALTNTMNQVTTCPGGAGVKLKAAAVGQSQWVANRTTNALLIYPASGDSINTLSADAPITLPPGEMAYFYAVDGDQWHAMYDAFGYQNMIEGQLSGSIPDGTYVMVTKAVYAFKINGIKGLKSTSGTATLKVKINSTDVTGLDALAVSSTPQDVSASGANSVAVGDQLKFVTSSGSSLVDIFSTLDVTRV